MKVVCITVAEIDEDGTVVRSELDDDFDGYMDEVFNDLVRTEGEITSMNSAIFVASDLATVELAQSLLGSVKN
jgi:hypothetical protein